MHGKEKATNTAVNDESSRRPRASEALSRPPRMTDRTQARRWYRVAPHSFYMMGLAITSKSFYLFSYSSFEASCEASSHEITVAQSSFGLSSAESDLSDNFSSCGGRRHTTRDHS